MKDPLARVNARRLELMTQIAAQRTELEEISQKLKKPLAVVDAGITIARVIFGHPALLAGSVTALVALRPKGVFGFFKTGWRLLRVYPSMLTGLQHLAAHFTRGGDAEA